MLALSWISNTGCGQKYPRWLYNLQVCGLAEYISSIVLRKKSEDSFWGKCRGNFLKRATATCMSTAS